MKKENGSIAIFALVALLFMTAFLIISYANIINNSKSLKEQFNIIKGIYYKSNDSSSYTDVYTDLRKKNRQNLTAYSENSNELELNKTFASKLVNYKIYGNSVQNETPTPDNPVEIQSLGDKKNLIDVQDFNVTFENSYYQNNSTGFLLQPNCTYTLSFNYKINSASENVGCGIGYGATHYAADINYMATYPNQTNGRFVNTFTTPADIGNDKYLFVRFARTAKTSNVNIDFSSIQLEIGSEATDYVPYGKYKIPVKVSGKNLFNIDAIDGAVIANGEAEKINNGWKVKGNYSGLTQTTRYENGWFRPGCAKGSVYIKANQKITVSADIKLIKVSDNYKNNNNINIYLYGAKDYTAPSQALIIDNTTRVKQTFTVEVSGNYYPVFTLQNNELEITNIQIEIGDKNTDFQSYIEPTTTNIYLNEPLRKVGNYADYIDFKSGKVVRNVEKFVFNGSELWVAQSSGAYLLNQLQYRPLSAMCDKFIFENTTTTWTENGKFGWSKEGTLWCAQTKYTATNTWKTWLSENNMMVYCQLQTPIEETITLPRLPAYEDYTKIEVLTEIAPSKIEVEYDGYTITE